MHNLNIPKLGRRGTGLARLGAVLGQPGRFALRFDPRQRVLDADNLAILVLERRDNVRTDGSERLDLGERQGAVECGRAFDADLALPSADSTTTSP